MPRFKCSGWYEELGYGRQQMDSLVLSFVSGEITGGGTDMVGDFRIDGRLEGDRVHLRKQYIGQHLIEYFGNSLGEGIYSGDWASNGYVGGKWLIRVDRMVDGPIDDVT